ncbi:RimJ/RimL family protein N-acetyltransferase [Kineothrix alysoides]|uniref:RimJ/RimL family protein N-acetyltransferase n=1 Tax=Kineothrix alysoides TaxID=1469948 RepID=A0A4R1QPH4_9FIRM|nr:GNAT family N-acetyltransferase [Kineothrix alysoides]TCL54801.1 RimJ/RimL family protein N-acetyltransferase [Kineothrix alysoides]
MLKEIVFLIGHKSQITAIEQMKKNFGEDGNKVITGNLPWEEGGQAAYDKENVLFVTDEEETLQALKQNAYYTIALLHGENKEQDLSAALYAITDIEELTFDSFVMAYMRLSGKPWTIMETKRCVIREMTVEDVDSFYQIYKEPSITFYMEDLFEEPEEEREYTREYIKKIYSFYGYGLWSIVGKESETVIGRAGISWREGFDIPELGFVIAVPYQHKGYAYEVCRAILGYGKEELGFDKVQALIKKDNEASIRLCTRLGFVRIDSVEDKGKEYERYVVELSDI